jgi:hypothetical protein
VATVKELVILGGIVAVLILAFAVYIWWLGRNGN